MTLPTFRWQYERNNDTAYFEQSDGILIPFPGCICLLKQVRNRTALYLLMANLGCLIFNISYALLLQTKTDEGALISLKTEYFGNVVFYFMFGLFFVAWESG